MTPWERIKREVIATYWDIEESPLTVHLVVAVIAFLLAVLIVKGALL